MNWLIFFLFFIIIFFFFFFFFFFYGVRDVVNKIRFWLLINVSIPAIVKVLSHLQGCMYKLDSKFMKVLNEIDNEENQTSKTQAIMFKNKKANLIVVAFRGTNSLDAGALITDLESELYEIKGHKKMEGRAHLGFMKALGLKKDLDWPKPEEITDVDYLSQHPAYYEIRERLRKQLLEDEEGKTKFIVTGHSLGGALAILFVGLLGYHEDTLLLEKMEGVYTFGQPRVGDDKFKDFMNSTIKKYGVKYLRYVYSNDVVTRVPFDVQIYPYKHFGESYIYFDCFYRGRVESEEINKNYFALRWLIPSYLIAICELIRSFAIHHIDAYGGDYKEGWLMITLRLLGLYFPGLSAHTPQDYVNISRLEISPPRSNSNRLFKRGMLAIIASFVLFYLIQWTNYYTNHFNKKI
ncbi:uncharacterized protein LOC114258292 [Camellia sinensis]|uniref:uncharacterized protein LOC114258292 n=1 Tax=Camellia sinensis TaxID=4442 RepID=UPI001035A107|nr:uncharacterized protein LOC114258292 [Camellia sinensis]